MKGGGGGLSLFFPKFLRVLVVGIDLGMLQNLILMGIWIGGLDSAYLFLFDAEFIG